MKVHVYTDTHGFVELEQERADLVLLLGDHDYRDLKKIRDHYTCDIFGVHGNHDPENNYDPFDIVVVHKRIINYKGLRIAGFSGCPTYNERRYHQYKDIEVKKYIEGIKSENIDLFMAHANPVCHKPLREDVSDEIKQFRKAMGTLNSDNKNPHRGFHAFDDLIEYGNVGQFVHGHIHEEKKTKARNTIIQSFYKSGVVHI